jgi:hypothetical protein
MAPPVAAIVNSAVPFVWELVLLPWVRDGDGPVRAGLIVRPGSRER